MGSTDIACAMATGDIWMRVPPTIKFVYNGKLSRWVGGKDVIYYTIGDNIPGVHGALYCAMEFHGEALAGACAWRAVSPSRTWRLKRAARPA